MSTSTSRIARRPVNLPAGVEVKLSNQTLTIKGPKGQHAIEVHPYVDVAVKDKQINVALNARNESITGAKRKLHRSIAGTLRATINNAVHGVTSGFEVKLALVGVGYRAASKGKVLSLSLGYSHPTDYNVPTGVTIETPSQTEIVIKGVVKELVGKVAADIRSIRSPEPYKSKGVRYANEVIEIKETKKK
jgi:large subunit ribosomal protein L6